MTDMIIIQLIFKDWDNNSGRAVNEFLKYAYSS